MGLKTSRNTIQGIWRNYMWKHVLDDKVFKPTWSDLLRSLIWSSQESCVKNLLRWISSKMAHCYFSHNTYLGIIIANQSQLFNISNASCKSDALSVEDYPFMQQLFIKCFLCARHCFRARDKTVNNPAKRQASRTSQNKEMTNKSKILTMSRIINALRKSREQTLWVLGLLASGLDSPLRTGWWWATPPAGRAPASESFWGEALRALGREETPPPAVGAVSPDSALPPPLCCLFPAGEAGGFPHLRGETGLAASGVPSSWVAPLYLPNSQPSLREWISCVKSLLFQMLEWFLFSSWHLT